MEQQMSYQQTETSWSPTERKAALAAGFVGTYGQSAFPGLSKIPALGQMAAGKNFDFGYSSSNGRGGLFRIKEYETSAAVGKGNTYRASGSVKLPKMTGGWSTAMFGGMAAFGAAKGYYQGVREMQAGSVSFYGNAPALDYDASANINRTTNARTFGADGQLVFGLHAGNHRG